MRHIVWNPEGFVIRLRYRRKFDGLLRVL
jgi:hypothetical protein